MFLTSVWQKCKGFLGKGISHSDWSNSKSGFFCGRYPPHARRGPYGWEWVIFKAHSKPITFCDSTILPLAHYSPAGSYQKGICKRGIQPMPEEGSESLSLTEHLLNSLRLKKCFIQVNNQFVCSCLSLDINKIFSRNRGVKFHCGAIYQGCSILCLIPRPLTF